MSKCQTNLYLWMWIGGSHHSFCYEVGWGSEKHDTGKAEGEIQQGWSPKVDKKLRYFLNYGHTKDTQTPDWQLHPGYPNYFPGKTEVEDEREYAI